MSYSYDRYERQRRSTYGASTRRSAFGYWIPLAVTVTAAAVGIAAWIWSERKENEDNEDYDHVDSDRRNDGPPPPSYGGSSVGLGQSSYGPNPGTDPAYPPAEDQSMLARMSGAIRRTPSPQQIFDGASRRVVAGVTAAGAAVGGALSSIREEDKKDFEDHSRWSEEAETRVTETRGPAKSTKEQTRKKTVAVVLSAEEDADARNEEGSYHQEHASILSHLPSHLDDETRLFVLIYAPELAHHPLSSGQQVSQPSMSMTSSYSNIGHEDAQSHSDDRPLETLDPRPISSPPRSKKFEKLYAEAQNLVEKETMIMPFTTPEGHVHLLRHLGPDIVYIQEPLTGSNGAVITQINNWVRQIVIVVGDESGHGGLVDSEDEKANRVVEGEKWWRGDSRIGLGKGVEVVEGLMVGDHWRRIVRGHD